MIRVENRVRIGRHIEQVFEHQRLKLTLHPLSELCVECIGERLAPFALFDHGFKHLHQSKHPLMVDELLVCIHLRLANLV